MTDSRLLKYQSLLLEGPGTKQKKKEKQITNGIFHRTRTKNFTVHMETQKNLNSQSSIEKEE